MDNLVKLSFIVSIIGLVCLLIFVNVSDVNETTISKIDQTGTDTKITGEITKIRTSDKVSTITLKQNCDIDVVVFDNLSSKNLTKGNTITVTGTKELQNGIYQIYADEISLKKK